MHKGLLLEAKMIRVSSHAMWKELRKIAVCSQEKRFEGRRPPATWSIPESRVKANGSSAQNKDAVSKSIVQCTGLALGLANPGQPNLPILFCRGKKVSDILNIPKITKGGME